MGSVEVLKPGALTTIQDLGRPGFAHLGVPTSGAADAGALRRANALVGNDDGAAALETTLAGPALRFDAPALIALSGAPARATLGERDVAFGEALAVQAGEVLELGRASAGVRSYIAVAGGIAARPVLGSRATDTLTGLGPAPLARGDRLELGGGASSEASPASARRSAEAAASAPEADDAALSAPTLRIVPGPRDALFTPEALEVLASAPFTVSPTSNRVGARLAGPRLERAGRGELPSEGLVRGALQVPPSGGPMLMLADHPTTGGYPVIAVVVEADHGLAGQLRPGAVVRFELVARR